MKQFIETSILWSPPIDFMHFLHTNFDIIFILYEQKAQDLHFLGSGAPSCTSSVESLLFLSNLSKKFWKWKKLKVTQVLTIRLADVQYLQKSELKWLTLKKRSLWANTRRALRITEFSLRLLRPFEKESKNSNLCTSLRRRLVL